MAEDRNPQGQISFNHFFFIGADPEIFLTGSSGRVVESSEVIPKVGLKTEVYYSFTPPSKIVRDGVQIELHPQAGTCRANVGNHIQECLKTLRNELKKYPEKYKVSFADVVTLDKKTFQTLSPEAKALGCMPSFNLYPPSRIRVNPNTYRRRSGGGHIHMSGFSPQVKDPAVARRVVQMLDVFVGNTCVLIDRSPNAATRRRVYGRAGEYRLPKYGIEYRTLSNFWMHSYPLFSLVAALCRMGASAVETSLLRTTGASLLRYADVEGIVLDAVNIPRIQKAINRNDLDLAWQNWEDLKPVIAKYYANTLEGIERETIPYFEFFAKKIQEHAASGTSKANGLDYWWNHDPFTHWCDKLEGHGTGWESFLNEKVYRAWKMDQAAKKAAALKEQKDADSVPAQA